MVCFCLMCSKLIPADRERRRAITCSKECQQQYRIGRLLERRLRVCATCGRPRLKKSQGTPFPPQETALQENTEREIVEHSNPEPGLEACAVQGKHIANPACTSRLE